MDLVRLHDGTPLLVRPIEATDKAMLAAGLTRLSETSRQRRFLGPKPKLTAAELRYLTEVDGHDHFAVVVVFPGTDDIVATARYVRLKTDPAAAEAAIVVCDALQNKGLGKQLAGMVADEARATGTRRVHATMLSENPPALRLMQVIAARLNAGGHDHGVREVVADLELAA